MRTLFNAALLASTAGIFLEEAGEGSQGTSLTNFEANLPAIATFDPKQPELFGNSLLNAFVATEAFDTELQAAQAKSDEVKKFIGFELAKAIMHAAEDTKGDPKKEINIYAIFENKTATEKLFQKLQQYFGIIKKEIGDDEIITTWTSKAMAEAYDYTAVDKEKDEAEYNRRSNNRKRLNQRFTDACKMAIALIDQGVKGDQLMLVENSTTKEVEPVIKDAPASLRGDSEKNGPTVTFGKVKANEGAKMAPNVAALVRAASEAHKKADATGTGERSDAGGERSGDAKLGMSDEDFGAIVNNLRRAVTAQENNLTEEMVKQLTALIPALVEALETNAEAAKQRAADAENGVDMSENGDAADQANDDGTGDETEVDNSADAQVEEVTQSADPTAEAPARKRK